MGGHDRPHQSDGTKHAMQQAAVSILGESMPSAAAAAAAVDIIAGRADQLNCYEGLLGYAATLLGSDLQAEGSFQSTSSCFRWSVLPGGQQMVDPCSIKLWSCVRPHRNLSIPYALKVISYLQDQLLKAQFRFYSHRFGICCWIVMQ